MSDKVTTIKSISNKAGKAVKKAGETVANAGANAVDKVKDIQESLTFEEVLGKAIKTPGVRIDREKYLRKQFNGKYSEDVIEKAILNNPAYAGISREDIDKMANSAIKYESSKVTAISAAAGIPGGAAMVATVPADTVQYFGFLLRIMQKLAYLYGFEEFDFSDDDSFDDDTMDEILIFTGVMFGVKNANAAIKVVANTAAQKISKTLARKALTKGAIYPMVKKVALAIGFKMNKQIFADALAKTVPVAGGVISGGLTYATFTPSAKRLKKKMAELNLSDPEFYKLSKEEQDALIEKDLVIDIDDEDLDIKQQ